MTTFLLIRHATHDLLARRIAGRMSGVHLSNKGREEAEQLATILASQNIEAIFTGPLERAIETAQPLAEMLDLQVEVCPALNELHYGDWTGLSFEELSDKPDWQAFNMARSATRIPGGETMREAQERIVREMLRLRDQHPLGTVAVVSHGDVIKAAIMYWLGIPLDHFLRFEISPASVSTVQMGEDWVRVLSLNQCCARSRESALL